MIKFFAAELVGIDELRKQLAEARARHQTILANYEAVQAQHYSEPMKKMPRWKQLIFMTLRLGMARERAWLEWADESDKALRS